MSSEGPKDASKLPNHLINLALFTAGAAVLANSQLGVLVDRWNLVPIDLQSITTVGALTTATVGLAEAGTKTDHLKWTAQKALAVFAALSLTAFVAHPALQALSPWTGVIVSKEASLFLVGCNTVLKTIALGIAYIIKQIDDADDGEVTPPTTKEEIENFSDQDLSKLRTYYINNADKFKELSVDLQIQIDEKFAKNGLACLELTLSDNAEVKKLHNEYKDKVVPYKLQIALNKLFKGHNLSSVKLSLSEQDAANLSNAEAKQLHNQLKNAKLPFDKKINDKLIEKWTAEGLEYKAPEKGQASWTRRILGLSFLALMGGATFTVVKENDYEASRIFSSDVAIPEALNPTLISGYIGSGASTAYESLPFNATHIGSYELPDFGQYVPALGQYIPESVQAKLPGWPDLAAWKETFSHASSDYFQGLRSIGNSDLKIAQVNATELAKSFMEHEQKLEQLTKDRDAKAAEYNALIKEEQALQVRSDELLRMADEAAKMFANAQTKVSEAQAQVIRLTNERHKLQTELDQLNNNLEKHQQSLNTAKEHLTSLNSQLKHAENNAHQAQADAQKLEKEPNEAAQALADAQTKVTEAQAAEVTRLTNERHEAQTALDRLNNNLEEHQQSLNTAKEHLTILNARLENAENVAAQASEAAQARSRTLEEITNEQKKVADDKELLKVADDKELKAAEAQVAAFSKSVQDAQTLSLEANNTLAALQG